VLVNEKNLAAGDHQSVPIIEGVTVRLAIPVSSSIEMKMNPLAVRGLCRAIMPPAKRTGHSNDPGSGILWLP
jgi:hypothetical protein